MEEKIDTPIKNQRWFHYVAAFFSGMFLANALPHYSNGISGNLFPSPFADPPGMGNSPPIVNVLWGAFNILLGYLLFRVSKTSTKTRLALLILFSGIICQGIMLSIAFSHRL